MPHYVVTKEGGEKIEQVVHYSSRPPQAVLDAWKAMGMDLIRVLAPPRSVERAREIARDPSSWKVITGQVVRR